MNIPSLGYIYREASKTLLRFPVAILTSVFSAICAMWLVDLEYSERQNYEFLFRMVAVGVLGISLFIFIVLTVEKRGKNKVWFWGGQILGLLLLVLYYFSLPEEFFNGLEKHGFRYALFFIGSHLLVAIAPFWSKGEINAFWQYNKTLFLRFLTAVLFSIVLYVGLIVAMLSIDNLFGISLPDEWYAQLFFVIVGVFNTWFFLSGVPEDLDQLNMVQEYPRGLKIITQYILIPLVIVYLVILYLYAGKIIVEWEWPEGWVAILTLCFSIVGIFSLLLLHPIRTKVENRWMTSFSKYYYISLIPLVIMLILAIWRRISEYRFTENRYFVLVLGIWLAGIVIYFIFSKAKSIKIIPGSLCIIVFLISFGPWGAFSISEHSQVNRLESLLIDNRILINGQIQKADKDIPKHDAQEISAVVRYLSEVHGFLEIQPWFKEDLDSLDRSSTDSNQYRDRWHHARNVVELMGVRYFDTSALNPLGARNFTSENAGTIHLNDYEWLIKNQVFNRSLDSSSIDLQQHTVLMQMNSDSLWMAFHISNYDNNIELKIDLEPIISKLAQNFDVRESYNIPQDQMSLSGENEWMKTQLNITNLNVRQNNESWLIEGLQTDILISVK